MSLWSHDFKANISAVTMATESTLTSKISNWSINNNIDNDGHKRGYHDEAIENKTDISSRVSIELNDG